MTDTGGVPSAIGIEAVERVAEPSGTTTVRITGRWRRRRPDWRGPAMLVIEAEGRRHRIPAMPDPPFLIGLLHGMWRMSFSVPAEFAAHLDRGAWLQLGAVMAPIAVAQAADAPEALSAPAPEPPAGEASEPEAPPIRRVPDRDMLLARELRSLEVAAQSARRRTEEAEERAASLRADIERLRDELARAREEPERLRTIIAQRERDLRDARQSMHAEAQARAQAAEDLTERERTIDALRARTRELTQRERELERDLRHAHRAVDEARHDAAIARGKAERARNALAQAESAVVPPEPAVVPPEPTPAPPESGVVPPEPAPRWWPKAVMAAEFGLSALAAPAISRQRVLRPSIPYRELGLERSLTRMPPLVATQLTALNLEVEAVTEALARERAAREAAEQRVDALQADLERQRERSRRVLATIDAFRRELRVLRTAPGPPAVAAPEAPLQVPQPPRPEPLDTSFEPDRLAAALARLRESHPADEEPAPAPVQPEPEPPASEPSVAEPTLTEPSPVLATAAAPLPEPGAPTQALPRLFRGLIREDPAAAGRLVLALLPAQHLAAPRPVAYDLILSSSACVQVTAGAGPALVALAPAPRNPSEVQFQLEGDAAAIARLLAAGAIRRRVGRGMARIRGDRRALQALTALVNTPQHLSTLVRAGVRLDAALTLRLIAEHLGPTPALEAFALAHRATPDSAPDAVLHVVPNAKPAVTEAPLEVVATTTIVCAPGDLLGVLLGEPAPGAAIRGETRPLAQLRRALQSA